MNKFTRSQMGKIMAYALSAAMAVTVVPTYMMKPLVAEAATQSKTEEKADADIATGDVIANGDAVKAERATSKKSYSIVVSSVLNLYSKKDDTKPAYTIKESSENKFIIPYTVTAGNYYAEVETTYASKDDSTAEDYETEVAKSDSRTLLIIEEATVVTGVSLSVTNKTLYFNSTKSNQEVVSTTLKGADNAKYKNIKYTITSDTDNAFSVNSTDVAKDSATSINELKDLKISKGTAATKGAKLTILVEVTVEGRENPLKDTIVITESDELEDVKEITMTAESEMILAGESTVINTSVNPTNSTKNIAYLLEGTKTDADSNLDTYTDGSVIKLVDKTTGGDAAKADSKDTVYATFDTSTGELVAKKYGEYTVTAFSDDDFSGAQNGDEVKGTAKVTAVSFEIVDTNVTVGNSAKKQGTLTVNPSTVTKAYATYTVENSDIATVSGTEKSFDVKAEKAGITKVNADITVYGKEVYKFESTGYIVVSPKDDDEDFDITEVDNTEAYINRLAKNGDLTGNLPLQVGEAIVDNKINVKTLSAKAVNLAESALSTDLNEYYSLTNEVQATDNRVTADGLLLSAYDPDVVAVENPDKSVKVKLVVSDLHADDKENYEKEDSICQFVAELTVDGKVTELNNPVWLTVTDDDFKKGGIYTVYDNGEAVYVSECTADGTLTFQTPSFSVFSIVSTPDATPTKFEADIENPDTPDTDDIYDKVNFSAHVQRRIGTDDEADIAATVSDDGIISLGTHGQSRRVEKITLTGLDADEVEMTAHVQKRVDHPEDVADLTQVVNEDGSISIGTEHQSRRIEAFSMNLKGDLAEKYDVYYRVHAQNYGWLGWAKNGEIAGTSGHSFRLEGIEIIFVEKGTEFDESQYVKTTEEGDRGYSEKAAYMDRVVSEK